MDELVKVFRGLADGTRLRMLGLLMQRECCVCEVMAVLKVSQTRASRNLGLLHSAGLLRRRKEGLWSYYSLNPRLSGGMYTLGATLEALLAGQPAVQADRKRLEKAGEIARRCCAIVATAPEGRD
jgi:ArsR family transcriptional regulator